MNGGGLRPGESLVFSPVLTRPHRIFSRRYTLKPGDNLVSALDFPRETRYINFLTRELWEFIENAHM